MTSDNDVLQAHVADTIGAFPIEWPGGWPDEVESALIDAVFSVRAKYGNRNKKTGVYGAVVRWREHRGGAADDLSVLAQAKVGELRSITNNGKLSGRYKAEVVIEAAGALQAAGIVHAADFAARQAEARSAYLSVRGCGPVTWAYLRMLLGLDDVKADTWVMRFVQDKLPHVRTSHDASELIKATAATMGVDARQLDHAIWRYQRDQKR